MTDLALLDVDGRVATVTLNRDAARNALSIDLLSALHARMDELAGLCASPAADVRVCVLAGAGRAFCAGMDLRLVLDAPGAPAALLHALAHLTLKVRALPVPTIARVHGAAIGGGCGLACVCDFAVTHDDAKVGFPEVDLGVCPAVVAPWLIRRLGAAQARRVLLEGGTMSGRRAAEIGMMTRSVPDPADLDAAVAELAGRLASGGPAAVRATKAWLNTLDGSLDPATVAMGADISAEVLAGPEARETLRAKMGSKG